MRDLSIHNPTLREEGVIDFIRAKCDCEHPDDDRKYLNNITYNWKTCLTILSAGKDRIDDFSNVKCIENTICIYDLNINCYRNDDNLIINDWWIFKGAETISSNFDYIVDTDNMHLQYMWGGRYGNSFSTFMILKDYYLKKFKSITSNYNPVSRTLKYLIALMRVHKSDYNISLIPCGYADYLRDDIDLNSIENFENYIENYKGTFKLRISNK